MSDDFKPMPKIGRLSRTAIITEKLDGTNSSIYFGDNRFKVGSRNRWITPEDDNFGFARWVWDNMAELLKLGPGHHFGEWWGKGIQRGYGLNEKRFSLFNVHRWGDDAVRPACCHVVPVLSTNTFDSGHIADTMETLRREGSQAAPGYMNPEGVVIFHTGTNTLFKKTFDKDLEGKGNQ